jgi:tRNA (guanine-N7-)-methyltransferase
MLTGRPLPGLIAAMQPDLQSAPAPPSLLYLPASFFEHLELKDIFPRPQPLEVELGCGDSSFLVEWAQRHPERNFLGVERLQGRLRKLDRKGRRAGLQNLRGLRIEAGYCLEYLLPAESLSALHVYFPDPWPKRRHWSKRLIHERFPQLAAQVLLPGACVYLRTDDEAYFRQMTDVFAASPLFQPVETPAGLRAILTDFENDFLALNRSTLRAAYQRV